MFIFLRPPRGYPKVPAPQKISHMESKTGSSYIRFLKYCHITQTAEAIHVAHRLRDGVISFTPHRYKRETSRPHFFINLSHCVPWECPKFSDIYKITYTRDDGKSPSTLFDSTSGVYKIRSRNGAVCITAKICEVFEKCRAQDIEKIEMSGVKIILSLLRVEHEPITHISQYDPIWRRLSHPDIYGYINCLTFGVSYDNGGEDYARRLKIYAGSRPVFEELMQVKARRSLGNFDKTKIKLPLPEYIRNDLCLANLCTILEGGPAAPLEPPGGPAAPLEPPF